MLLHGDIIVHSGQHQLDTSKVACNKAKDLRDFIQSLSSQLYNLKNNLQKHMKKTTHTHHHLATWAKFIIKIYHP